MQNFLPQFENYKKCCMNSNGGIFFLVFGGKFSEGIDFKDELARMVIILGIPFSNPQELKLLAKKDYIEKTERGYRSRAHKARMEQLASIKAEAIEKEKAETQATSNSTQTSPNPTEEPIATAPFETQTDSLETQPKPAKEPETKEPEQKFTEPEPLNYSDWYFNEAFLQINQAAGRVKRSESDYGTILLIDARFSDKRYEKFLSPLLRALEIRINSSKELYSFLDEFYRKNLLKAPLQEKAQAPDTQPKLMFPKAEKKMPVPLKNVGEGETDCVVCYQKSSDGKKLMISKCGHIACETCWQKCLAEKLECMICREKIRMNNLKLVVETFT